MWVTTAGRGLYSIDLAQRSYAPSAPALHGQMDGMILDSDDGMLYVGLMGNQGPRVPNLRYFYQFMGGRESPSRTS